MPTSARSHPLSSKSATRGLLDHSSTYAKLSGLLDQNFLDIMFPNGNNEYSRQYSDKIVSPVSGLEIPPHIEKEASPHIEKEAAPYSPHSHGQAYGHRASAGERKLCGIPRKYALAAIAVFIAVVVGVVVGVVFATRPHNSNTPATRPHNSDTPATSAAPPPPPSPGNSTAEIIAQYSSIRNDSKLAAVAFKDFANSSTTVYRVYYQDSDNYIKESSWNSTAKSWYVSNSNITKARAATPIAAAAIGPGDVNSNSSGGWATRAFNSQQIYLYYLEDSNNINEIFTDSSSSQWSSGTLTSENYTAANTSALAAVWHAHATCMGCPNTLLLSYQNTKYQMQIVNGTQDGWVSYPLNTDPISNTGLSINLHWSTEWMTAVTLYYQIADGSLVSHIWNGPAQIEDLNSRYSM